MRYAFAGDREISCNILKFIIKKGFKPSALMVGDRIKNTHALQLTEIANLDDNFVFSGTEFRQMENIKLLRDMELDYIFGIHFPYIIPKEVLKLPSIGFLNLHPAFLPYNKGWHTPSWAILEGTPYGATLHFMSEYLDEGDIIHQKKIFPTIIDTANSLYQKVLKLEEEVFFEAFEEISEKRPPRNPQNQTGSSHSKKDLARIQEISLNKDLRPLELINKLRALTTNQTSELAYFVFEGRKIGIKVELLQMDEI